MVIIRYAINNPNQPVSVPEENVLEVLSALSSDQDNLADKELIYAAYALA
ncbi:MAG: hypothetical protein ACKOW9_05700 [Candidatus Paceibacterota bacterium]